MRSADLKVVRLAEGFFPVRKASSLLLDVLARLATIRLLTAREFFVTYYTDASHLAFDSHKLKMKAM